MQTDVHNRCLRVAGAVSAEIGFFAIFEQPLPSAVSTADVLNGVTAEVTRSEQRTACYNDDR